MKSIVGALIGATLLLALGPATAQPITINDHVVDLVKKRLENHETLTGAVETAELGEAEISEFVFKIDPGKTYHVRGACDDDCSDIDLQAFDAAGESVAEDTLPNELPKIEILPGKSGAELHVIVSMETCDLDTCIAGVGLFQSDN